MAEPQQACTTRGLEHTWQRRGETEGGGAFLFCCSTSAAWGWATRKAPSHIRQYSDPFKSRARPPDAQPTVLPAAERKLNENTKPTEWVDRRGDRPTKRRGEYNPRFGLDDWDNETPRGGRSR